MKKPEYTELDRDFTEEELERSRDMAKAILRDWLADIADCTTEVEGAIVTYAYNLASRGFQIIWEQKQSEVLTNKEWN